MSINQKPQIYRAQVGAIIFNSKKQFFLIQNHGYPKVLWEFVKGGMHFGESPEEILTREIKEELGDNVEYQILRKSSWNYIYEWPKEKQAIEGMRGQARISFWVFYTGGEINPLEDEIRDSRWFDENEFKEVFQNCREPHDYSALFADWEQIKQEYVKLLKTT